MKPAVLVMFVAACFGADNTLSPEEKKSGFRLLFDGKTFRGWQDPAKKNPPGDAWLIEDGCLKTRVKPRLREDLLTAQKYGDFELLFEWKVSAGGNTGVKYRLQRELYLDDVKVIEGPGGFEGMVGREMDNPAATRAAMLTAKLPQIYTVGFEFQLLDDERHPDAKKDSSHVTGALYSMLAPRQKADRPAGEWNSGRLVVRGKHFEHWVNGVKVLDGELDDPRARAGIEKRWKPAPKMIGILENPGPPGWIALQHHGDEVWFKNVKIR